MYVCLYDAVAASKGEAEPERKETRTKVDEDRKHEYPLPASCQGRWQMVILDHTTCFIVVFCL